MPSVGVPTIAPHRIPLTQVDGEIVPSWLGDRDRPWLRDLIEAAAGYVGRRVCDWIRRCRDSDIDPRAGGRQVVALHVLEHWLRRSAAAPARSALRLQLYRARSGGAGGAAGGVAVAGATDRDSMFDDMPLRRAIRWPDRAPEPTRLAHVANTTMAQSILRHASSVVLGVFGASHAVLRTAWLHGARLKPVAGNAGGAAGPLAAFDDQGAVPHDGCDRAAVAVDAALPPGRRVRPRHPARFVRADDRRSAPAG